MRVHITNVTSGNNTFRSNPVEYVLYFFKFILFITIRVHQIINKIKPYDTIDPQLL